DCQASPTGGRTVCKQSVISPVSSCTLLCTAMQSSVLTVKHKHSPVCKTAHS
ncbi:unnamed protein product, partial [Staurois parvus]